MSAETYWKVKVLRLVEDEIKVKALTHKEAMTNAESIPGVARAVSADGRRRIRLRAFQNVSGR